MAHSLPLLGAVAVVGITALHAAVVKEQADFAVFRLAATRAMAGQDLYHSEEGSPYKYAPIVALALAPITLVPRDVGAVLWTGLSALLLVLFACWARDLAERSAAVPASGLIWSWSHLLVAILTLPFAKMLFALGQSDIALLTLLTASESLSRRRPIASAVPWALACLVKPTFLIFIPITIAQRQWRRLTALPLALLALLALPSVVYGWAGNLDQLGAWRALLAASKAMLCQYDNQAIAGIVCRYLAEPTANPRVFWSIVATGSVALASFFFWCAWRMRNDPPCAICFGMAASFYLSASVSPHGWRSALLGMIPLLYILVRAVSKRRWWKLSLVVPAANALLGLAGFELLGPSLFASLVVAKAFGFLALLTTVLAALALLCLSRSSATVETPDGYSYSLSGKSG